MITTDYQFPIITEDMHSQIEVWQRTHNRGRCYLHQKGLAGGDVKFIIIPTSLGNYIQVKCSCGKALEFKEV